MICPKITIAAPVHNRAWILPDYLEHILRLDYPKNRISLHFVVNNSTDGTWKILSEFAEENSNKFKKILIEEVNFERKFNKDSRDAVVRKQESYRILSDLRNRILDQFLKDYENIDDHLFFVDSDVMLRDDSIIRLLAHEKDAVAALICNDKLNQSHIYNFMNLDYRDGIIKYCRNFQEVPEELFEVDLTGAAFLLSAEAVYAGRYSNGKGGEDESFCGSLQSAGMHIFIDGSLRLSHIMEMGDHKNGR